MAINVDPDKTMGLKEFSRKQCSFYHANVILTFHFVFVRMSFITNVYFYCAAVILPSSVIWEGCVSCL